MELQDYLVVLRKYWRSLVAVTLIGVIATAVYCVAATPKFTAKASLFFSVDGATSASDLAQGTSFAQAQVASYMRVATSPIVLDPVIATLHLETTSAELAKNQVRASVPTDTSIVDIEVIDPNPTTAAVIANAIGAQLVDAASSLSPDTINGQKAVVATVIAPATAPTEPTSPKVLQNLVLGLLLGLSVGIAQAIARNTLDTRIRTAADVAKVTEAPVVAQISYDKVLNVNSVLDMGETAPRRVEAFRRLRTNLQYLDAGRGSRSFVVTSSIPDEGKTYTSVNTAIALAASGLRVLLIDADMRNPSVGRSLGLDEAAGLSTLLIGRAELRQVVQSAGNPPIEVLTAGPIPPNPPELLGSPAMTDLLDTATRVFDTVVIDAPPLLAVTDAAILSRMTSGALVVISSGGVRIPQVEEALSSLASVNGRVLGIVLNKVRGESAKYYGYYNYRQGTSGPAPKGGAVARSGAIAERQMGWGAATSSWEQTTSEYPRVDGGK